MTELSGTELSETELSLTSTDFLSRPVVCLLFFFVFVCCIYLIECSCGCVECLMLLCRTMVVGKERKERRVRINQ